MSKLHKIIAGLALGTAAVGGAMALGAGAAGAATRTGDVDRPIVRDGLANGVDDSTGGIAQGNRGVGERGDRENVFPVFSSPNNNVDRNNQNHNLNQNNDNCWWNNQQFWNQGAFADRRDDFSGFGLVAKDVAIGFQDKTNKDNTWFNNAWWNNNNWWNCNDDNWWNNNNNDHVN
ncbi:hypothetical protein [Microbispora triticiradicis]|uniref:hypothetical protein n=1 Tax=Microbispora triticiradicis TaxID=2200763 RepID=UPI001AD796EE|nr:hypothetical protein [Microbispora triticiradicis]MBO4275734.1 hypothetical protein [Microbispora triticiradicis]